MKKMLGVFLAAALIAALFAGCGAKQAAGGVEGTPEEIIAKIYAAHKEIDLSLVGMDVDLTDADAVKYYLGIENGDALSAAAVSETMLGQPYSLVVARAKNAADADKLAKQMFDGIDTRKWICVAADTKAAAVSGDVILFFMINSEFADVATTDSILEAFKTVCGGAVTII